MVKHKDGVLPLDKAIFSAAVDFSNAIPTASLQEKTILITGGASGIGAALCLYLAEHGANVIIGDNNEQQGVKMVARMRQLSSNYHHHFLKLDVSSWESQLAFFKNASTLSPHGGIDSVVANAAINDSTESEQFEINVPKYSQIKESPPALRLKTLRVALDGVLYTATLALSYLSDNPGSNPCSLVPKYGPRDRHILLVSSVAGVTALPASSIYTVAKHGVVGLFRSLRLSSPILHGVRVNMLCPQYVETPIHGVRGSGMLAGVAKTEMDDVVAAAARLLADHKIIGRALLAGSRGSPEQIEAAGLVSQNHVEGALWDIYGGDFDQSDLLVRRIVALLNLASYARGWVGIAEDSIKFAYIAFLGFFQACLFLFRR